MFKRLIASLVCLTFSFSNLQYVHAQDFSIKQLPVPGTMVGESAPFAPLTLKGLIVNPQKPLEFQFIVDTGRGPQDTASVKDQANQLVKYFLAGLTIPEGDLWVNLSPYEKDRMVPAALGQTDLGRDLLAQDYILKQLTASLIYPEKDLGKEFWSRVYAKAQKQFGTTNVPVNTFNKVWILPDQAQVFENVNAAYVTKSTLKIMLDEDYLAKQKHQATQASSISSQIVRQIILPEIEKEVNTGKNFAPLRQIYQALILAKWYKETIQNGLLDAVYTNKNKIAGVNLSDPAVKEQIYNRYLQAYKKGAFNYIKEAPTPDGQVVPRKYFSGGTSMAMIVEKIHNNRAMLAKGWVAGALLSVVFLLGSAANTALAQSNPPSPTISVQTFQGNETQQSVYIKRDDKDIEKLLTVLKIDNDGNPKPLEEYERAKARLIEIGQPAVPAIIQILKDSLPEKELESIYGHDLNPYDSEGRVRSTQPQRYWASGSEYQTGRADSGGLQRWWPNSNTDPDFSIRETYLRVKNRERLISILASIGGQEARGFLENLSNDANENQFIRIFTREELGRSGFKYGAELVVDGLLERLKSGDAYARADAAKELGKIGDKRAIPGLIEVVKEWNWVAAPEAAADALVKIGPAAIPAIREALNDSHLEYYVREKLNIVLKRINDAHQNNSEKSPSRDKDHAMLGPSPSRREFLIKLGVAGIAIVMGGKLVNAQTKPAPITKFNEEEFQANINILKSDMIPELGVPTMVSSSEKLEAFSYIFKLGDERAIEPIIEGIEASTKKWGFGIPDGIAKIEGNEDFKLHLFIRMLDMPAYKGKFGEVDYSYYAVFYLSELRDKRAIEPIRQHLDNFSITWDDIRYGYESDRQRVRDVLAGLGASPWQQLSDLERAGIIISGAGGVGLVAWKAISKRGSDHALLQPQAPKQDAAMLGLKWILWGDKQSLHGSAVSLLFLGDLESQLKKYMSKQTDDELIGLLNYQGGDWYTNPLVHYAAAEALGYKGKIEPLIRYLDNENYKLRQKAAYALGEIKNPNAVEPLIKHFSFKDSSAFPEVVEALGKIGDSRAIEPLLKLLPTFGDNDWLTGKNKKIRLISALERIQVPAERVTQVYNESRGSIDALSENEDWRVRAFAYRILRRLKDVRVVDAFNKFDRYGKKEVNQKLKQRQPLATTKSLMDFENQADQFWLEGYDFEVRYLPEKSHIEDTSYQGDYGGLMERKETVIDQSERLWIERGDKLTDKASLAENGGIDLNQINVKRNGKTVNVQFDPAQLTALEQGGFEGFTPVIINITHISSPFQLLGINPAKQEVLAKA